MTGHHQLLTLANFSFSLFGRSFSRSQKRHSRHGHAADKMSSNHLTVSPGGGLVPGLPSSRRHQKSMPISPVPEDENSSSSTTSSSGNSPVVLLSVNIGDVPDAASVGPRLAFSI